MANFNFDHGFNCALVISSLRAACCWPNCFILSLNDRALTDVRMDFPLPLPDVPAIELVIVVLGPVSMSFSLSSLVDLCSLSTQVDIELLAVIVDGNDACLASECCKLLIRSRNDTFGLTGALCVGAAANDDGIKPAIKLVVVLVVAFKELNIEFDATASLIVVTAGIVACCN